MQKISVEGKLYELRPEVLEDLWILSQFIVSGDMVYGTTERKVKIGNENNPKVVRKLIKVELRVSRCSFESEQLRVSGEIQNETEFTAVGASHTISFSLNDPIKIEKVNILKFEEKLLKNSIESKKSLNLLVLLDKDDLVAIEFSEFSYRILFEKNGLGSKKYYSQEIDENEEKYKIIEPFLRRDYNEIIFSGPGNFKDKLSKYVDNKGFRTITHFWHDTNSRNSQKIIDDLVGKGVLENVQISNENKFVSELLRNIEKDQRASYGEDKVFNSIDLGSVEVLLVTTKYIDRKKEEEKYLDVVEKMRVVEQLNGELFIVQSKNDSGKILDGLGGIGSILRY